MAHVPNLNVNTPLVTDVVPRLKTQLGEVEEIYEKVDPTLVGLWQLQVKSVESDQVNLK